MKFIDLLLMSISNLWKRKLRTVLTVLGVVIGITSIMVMVALGNGLKEATVEQIASYSSITNIEVESKNYWSSSSTNDTSTYLSDDLIDKILAMDHVEAVYPRLSTNVLVKAGKYVASFNLTGITKEEMATKNFDFAYGGLPTSDTELELIYGNMFVTQFYNPKTYEYPYYDKGEPANVDVENGKMYFIFDTSAYYDSTKASPKKYQLKTAGILAGGLEDYNQDSYNVYCDLDVLESVLKKVYKKSAIPNQPTRKNGKAYDEIFYSELNVQVDDISYVTEISDTIEDMGFYAYNNASWIESETEQLNTIQAILGAIGAVSLLVAAIGITNTMMMSIYERTKEIGVMKVLGCDMHNIQTLFLLEAAFIGLLGGIFGVALSYGLGSIINYMVVNTQVGSSFGISTNICRIPIWLPGASIGFAIIIGMVAGFIPSLRAMKLSPLAAIRNE